MDPIRYNRRQLSLMVAIAAADSAGRLAETTATSASELQMMAAGSMAPTSAILAFFDLRRDGKDFVWQPR
jgi:hypothetical protein